MKVYMTQGLGLLCRLNKMALIKEWKIRRTLRKLSRQRVRAILQPGNAWLIENALISDDETDAAIRTCYMRGWVEPIVDAIPHGRLRPDGRLPDGPIMTDVRPVYRLTEAGWSVINRAQLIAILTIFLSILTLILSKNN